MSPQSAVRTPRTRDSGWSSVDGQPRRRANSTALGGSPVEGVGEEEVDLAVAVEVGDGDGACVPSAERCGRRRETGLAAPAANATAGTTASGGGLA